MGELTTYEIRVLQMLAGEREEKWGAWVSACLEHLQSIGYCSRGPSFQITPAGRAALARSAEGE
jgi:hypothetical protein